MSDWAKLYPNLSHYISSYQIEENPLILHQILRVALDCTNLYCVVPSWTKLFQVLPDRIRFDQFPQVCADFFTLASDGSRFCWIAPECARLYQIARSAPTSFKVYLCQLVPDCIKSYQILPSCTKATNCIIIFVIVSEIYLNLLVEIKIKWAWPSCAIRFAHTLRILCAYYKHSQGLFGRQWPEGQL